MIQDLILQIYKKEKNLFIPSNYFLDLIDKLRQLNPIKAIS